MEPIVGVERPTLMAHRLVTATVLVAALVAAGCSASGASDELSPFLVDPDDPDAGEYTFEVPTDAAPVIGVFSLGGNADTEAIGAALASADDPVQQEFFACDPVVAWIEPTHNGYRFDWEEGFVNCSEAIPHVAIYEIPA